MKTTLNWGLLKKLYAIHSPSSKEGNMIAFLTSYLHTIPEVTLAMDDYGNLYASKGESETYPCVVAHLDQVQKIHSKDFKAIETKHIIFGYSPSNHSFEGVGADDKNGILICLEALKKYDRMKCVFFREEEIGCRGSLSCDMEFFNDCRFVIQCDRRGNSDLITTIGGTDLCSNEFIKAINPEEWGYKETQGMMTDVETLKENELAVSAINISCGYFNPHTDEEITVKHDLEKCWKLVQHIIEDCTDTYPHEFGEYDSYRGFFGWDLEDEIFSILQGDPTLTPADLHDMYQTNYPMLSLEDFERIVEDYKYYYTCEDDEEYELINDKTNGKEKINKQEEYDF